MDKFKSEAERIKGKLSNANFVDRAPEAVVNKEREKLAEAESALNSLLVQAEKNQSSLIWTDNSK